MAYSTDTFGKAIIDKTNGTMNIFGEFKRITEPVDIVCNRCGEIKHYAVSANAIKYDVFCTKCDLENRKLKYQKIEPKNKISKFEAKQKVRDASMGIMELVSEYTGLRNYHDFKCNKCGTISSREFNSVVYMGRRGCDFCGSNMVESGSIYYAKFKFKNKTYFKLGSSRHDAKIRIVPNSIGSSAKILELHVEHFDTFKTAISIENFIHSKFRGMSTSSKVLHGGNTEVYDFDILGFFDSANSLSFIDIIGRFFGENELKL